ncbi:MAG: GNAT family N-acetyltransferase [Myxococcota bacterium]
MQLEADTLKALDFLPLQQQHLALMHTWLNTPHVNTWWENRPWSVQEIADKYGSQIHKNTGVDGFIIQIHKLPVGFIQRYIMPNHLPEVSDAQLKKLQKQMGASDGVGLDMFIGDANWVGKGLGPVVLHQFLQRHVWPKWHVAVADPHHSNTRALSAYTKAGFHSLNHQQVTSSTYKPLPMRAIRPTA